MKNFKKDNKGFTLIELLVVVAIIALLASVVMTALSEVRARGRDSKRTLDIKEVMKAIEMYYSDNGYYPYLAENPDTAFTYPPFADLLKNYIVSLPTDPLRDIWHTYRYITATQYQSTTYAIRVRFETMNQTGIIFGNPSYGYGYCSTGVNVHYGWWGGGTTETQLPQCTAIPHI